jgi:beta-glucosidase
VPPPRTPGRPPSLQGVETSIPAQRDGAIARSIAGQSAVLLKNSHGLLPLRAVHSVAIIGPYGGAAHTGGGGSSAVTPLYTVTPVDGIKSHGVTVSYDDGSDPAAAAALARSADIAVVMVGNKDKEDGNVVADLLFGDANPSGKLPMTFPKAESQTPANTPERRRGGTRDRPRRSGPRGLPGRGRRHIHCHRGRRAKDRRAGRG